MQAQRVGANPFATLLSEATGGGPGRHGGLPLPLDVDNAGCVAPLLSEGLGEARADYLPQPLQKEGSKRVCPYRSYKSIRPFSPLSLPFLSPLRSESGKAERSPIKPLRSGASETSANHLLPFARLCVLQSIWQFSMSVEPPRLQAVTWSASMSRKSQIFVWFWSWPMAQSGQLLTP